MKFGSNTLQTAVVNGVMCLSLLLFARDAAGQCEESVINNRAVRLLLILQQVTDIEDLVNTDKPQGMAFDWLLTTDPAEADPCTYSTVVQRYALAVLYYGTGGSAKWGSNGDWLTVLNECDWSDDWRIRCSNGTLTRLALAWNGLTGQLPSEIGALTSLTYLYLGGNELTGTIPATLFETPLQQLYLYSNSLTGSIPSNWGKATNLEIFYVHDNQLTGTVPEVNSSAMNMKVFYLNGNHISGSMPASVCAAVADPMHADCAGTPPDIECDCCDCRFSQ